MWVIVSRMQECRDFSSHARDWQVQGYDILLSNNIISICKRFLLDFLRRNEQTNAIFSGVFVYFCQGLQVLLDFSGFNQFLTLYLGVGYIRDPQTRGWEGAVIRYKWPIGLPPLKLFWSTQIPLTHRSH